MADGIMKQITLTLHQREVLKFIAENGGRCPFQLGVIIDDPKRTVEENKKIAHGSDESIKAMAEQLHVINMTPIIGQKDYFELTLTDAGRQVLDQMTKMEATPGIKIITSLEDL